MKRTKIRILTLVMAAILILGVCSMTLASAFTFEVGQVVYVRSFKSILVAQDKVSGDLVVLTPGAGKKVTILEIDDGWALVSMVKTYLAADGSLVEIETLGAIALSDLIKEMPKPSTGGAVGSGCPNGLCEHSLSQHASNVFEGETYYWCQQQDCICSAAG